jgi:hypothetical protein
MARRLKEARLNSPRYISKEEIKTYKLKTIDYDALGFGSRGDPSVANKGASTVEPEHVVQLILGAPSSTHTVTAPSSFTIEDDEMADVVAPANSSDDEGLVLEDGYESDDGFAGKQNNENNEYNNSLPGTVKDEEKSETINFRDSGYHSISPKHSQHSQHSKSLGASSQVTDSSTFGHVASPADDVQLDRAMRLYGCFPTGIKRKCKSVDVNYANNYHVGDEYWACLDPGEGASSNDVYGRIRAQKQEQEDVRRDEEWDGTIGFEPDPRFQIKLKVAATPYNYGDNEVEDAGLQMALALSFGPMQGASEVGKPVEHASVWTQPGESINSKEGFSQNLFTASSAAIGFSKHKVQADITATADQTSMVIFSSAKTNQITASSPIDCSASSALGPKQFELLREAAKKVLETEDISHKIYGCNHILQIRNWVQCNMHSIVASYLPESHDIDEAGVLKSGFFNTSQWANPGDQAMFLG